MPLSQHTTSGSHSSHINLSQGSVTSDLLGKDDHDGSNSTQQAKIAERRSNSTTDIQGISDPDDYGFILILG